MFLDVEKTHKPSKANIIFTTPHGRNNIGKELVATTHHSNKDSDYSYKGRAKKHRSSCVTLDLL
jgi:hypothetical protein